MTTPSAEQVATVIRESNRIMSVLLLLVSDRHTSVKALLLAAILFAGSQLMFAGARKGRPAASSAAVAGSITKNDSLRFNYYFLEAVAQQNAGHYDAAFDLLNHCLDINPHAAEAYFMRSLYLSELKKDSLALRDLQTAAQLRPDNDTYLERLAQFYLGMQDYAKATDAYERLYATHDDRTDVLNILIQLYQQSKNYDGMLRCINRIGQVEGETEAITMSKMRVYELKGDKKNALRTLKELAKEHPNDLNYKIMMGNWLMQHQRQKEAFDLFTEALKEEPDNSYAQGSMYDYYRANGMKQQAADMRDRILLSDKTPLQTKMVVVRQVIADNEAVRGDSTEVLTLLDRMMKASPKDADVASLKVAYMQLKKMPKMEVDSALHHLLALSPDNAGARLQLVQNALQGNTVSPWPKQLCDSIIEICKPALQYNPDEMAFYYYLGLAYFMKDDNDRALDTFRRGVGEINSQSNPDIVSDFYAIMGDILHQKGLDEQAYAAYDSCLQWKPDNVSCLNNYAYYLSVKGENLQKAEAMSLRTVKAEPKNATYLDTYAWILFMQKRYAEAKIYIDQAVQNDSTLSDVVLEHAGDIHSMNNDVVNAVKYWKLALEKHKDVNEAVLRKKIKLRRYVKE